MVDYSYVLELADDPSSVELNTSGTYVDGKITFTMGLAKASNDDIDTMIASLESST